MGGIWIWDLIIVLLVAAIWVVPLARIFKKAGYNPLWSILCVFPLFGLIMLWVLAFVEWPNTVYDA